MAIEFLKDELGNIIVDELGNEIIADNGLTNLELLESKWNPFTLDVIDVFVDLALLESVWTPFAPTIRSTVLIPDQANNLHIVNTAEYKILLRNHNGELLRHIKAYQSAFIEHKENDVGSFTLIPFETDDLISLMYEVSSTDFIFEIQRRNSLLGLDWYIEWEGFFTDIADITDDNGVRQVALTGSKFVDLVKRRNIRRRTLNTIKAGLGEAVIKEYVNEEVGPGATIASGRITDGVTTGFSIEADAGGGLAGFWSLELKESLLGELQKIARETLVDFDVVHLGDAQFEFRCYNGQRGIDRRFLDMDSAGKNSAGNTPMIFALNRGNISTMSFNRKVSGSKNAVLTLGGGKNEEQLFDVDQDFEQSSLSPWNMRETLVNESGTVDQDVLDSASEKAIANNKIKEAFGLTVLQQESAYYGKHYYWGDLISAFDQEGILRHKKIDSVVIQLTGSGTSEKIAMGFREYP